MASATMGLGYLAAPITTPKPTGMGSSFAGIALKTPLQSPLKKNSTSRTLKVNSMLVWEPYGNERWETLSYLPPLTTEQILKQVDYLLRSKWVPCLEFDENASIKRIYHTSPGYYDGRYWTMWKLPMFGCNDSAQVIKEVNECKKAYPKAFIRIIGFDSVRQVQCISFVAHKP